MLSIGLTGASENFDILNGNVKLIFDGVFNPNINSVTSSLQVGHAPDVVRVHKDLFDDKHANFDTVGASSGTLVGADLSKQVSFLLSKLTHQDVVANSGAPLQLKANSKSGTSR